MKIVIVGGGTAGWMTASTLVKAYPDWDISLYESPGIPPTGVGESTTQFFRLWLNFLGLQDEDWMAACDATYKISVRFTNFHDVNDIPWQYPFGVPRNDGYTPDFWFWYAYRAKWGYDKFADDYYLAAKCSKWNRLPIGEYAEQYYRLRKHSGFHFNAVKFANWLRDEYATPRGVKHYVEDVDVNNLPEADLYFDCTGFKSLLNDSPWKDFYDYLPNDRAWVTQIPYGMHGRDPDWEMVPVTDCTALSSGWVWNVPTWNRIGTGYVFCSDYLSEEAAKQEFKEHLGVDDDHEFRLIKFKTGRKKEAWKGNVVSIGLSAGFVEPLESNGLLSIQNYLLYFLRVMHSQDGLKKNVTQFMRDTFNNHCNYTFDAFASFVASHYAMTNRNDTPYWRHVSNIRYPYGGKDSITGAQVSFMEESSNFADKFSMDNLAKEGLFCIMAGHGWNPFNDVIYNEMDFFGYDVPDYNDMRWDEDELRDMPLPIEYYKETLYAS